MSSKAIESTVQKTHEWLEAVSGNLAGNVSRDTSYNLLRAVLHALRDRLTVDGAAHLGAQLPMLIRGLYFEGWHPSHKPLRVRHADEFVDLVEEQLSSELIDVVGGIGAVFRALEQHLDPGAIDKLLSTMPAELRELWQDSQRESPED
jgi:uncharacterized protein (DUF2267 family)